MFKYLRNFLGIFACFLFLANTANANMHLSPTKFEFETTRNQKYLTGAINLKSNNDKEVRFKIYSGYFEVSKEGMIEVEFPIAHKKHDVKNIYVNPKEITLLPDSTQTIRFTIPNIDKLPDGESRAVIFIEDKKTKDEALPSPKQGINAVLTIKQRMAIPIYITKGKIIRAGSVTKLALNKNQYELHVVSKGNSTIRVNGVVQLIQKNKIISESRIRDIPVLPTSTRIISGDIGPNSLNLKEGLKLKTKIYYLNAQNRKVILSKEIELSKDNV